jgi:hypothetical protein
MAQTLGIVEIIWRGTKLSPEKGAKVRLGGLKNTAIVYGRKIGRHQEMETSMVTAVVPYERGMRLLPLWADGEGQLQVLCDTGQTLVFNDAFLTNRPEATSGEGGKVEVTWEASPGDEILNG